jgi:membrane dipeptidase
MERVSEETKKKVEAAEALHRNSIVIDGLAGTTFAFEKLMAAGITAAHITVAAHNEGFLKTLEFIKDYYASLDTYPEKLLLVRTADDILKAKREEKLGLILGFQTASPIEEDLTNLGIFYVLGVRIVQITYMGRNLAGDGCYEPRDEGLTYFGIQIVRELNRLGMVVDLSHVGWKTAADAIAVSTAPVILSHSNPYRLCPNKRNVPDELIKEVAAKGGCIGVNGHPAFCEVRPGMRPTLQDYLDIVDYLVHLVGTDHVSLGPDLFEGFTEWQANRWNRRYDELRNPWGTVEGLGRAADIPSITHGLLTRGYSDADVQKIIGLNLLRIFRTVWG